MVSIYLVFLIQVGLSMLSERLFFDMDDVDEESSTSSHDPSPHSSRSATPIHDEPIFTPGSPPRPMSVILSMTQGLVPVTESTVDSNDTLPPLNIISPSSSASKRGLLRDLLDAKNDEPICPDDFEVCRESKDQFDAVLTSLCLRLRGHC